MFLEKIICYYLRNSVLIKKKTNQNKTPKCVSSPYTYVECNPSTPQSKTKQKNLTKPYGFWVNLCTLMFHFAFDFFCCWHFCSYESMDALKQRFDLSCLSLPHEWLSVINITPSDCGVSNGIPYPKITPQNHTLFTLGKNCWEERCKWLLSLLLMSDRAHPCTKNQTDPAGSEQSFVPDLCLCFAGEPASEAVLKPPSPSFPIRKYWNGSPLPKGETTVPSSHLAWQLRPAVHSCAPSQQQEVQAHSF